MTFFGGLFKGLAALAVSVLAFGLFSSAAAPIASFTMSPPNPVVGQLVQFADTSTGSPTFWSWNFGDGSPVSTQQNPTHVYGGPGPFNVTLIAANADGTSAPKLQVVFVSLIDTLRLDPPDSGGHPFKVTLTARDTLRTGLTGPGQALPQNQKFGYFSLPALTGDPSNPEVFVKVLDGTGVNGQYWVFYGHLTDLEYTLSVTEVTTGRTKTYHKDPGNSPGGFDTSGFNFTPTPTPTATSTPTPTLTPTPTPTVPALTVVNLVASNFQWSFDGGGDSFTFHVGRAYQLRVSRDSGTLHQFSGISAFGCSGSSLTSTAVCNFTPTAGQIGTHGFGCTNSGCGSGHDSMSASGKAIVAP